MRTHKNIYTQVDIPGSIDHLVDELKDKYNRPLPAADLLLTNAYDELMSGVVDVKDLASGVIGGTRMPKPTDIRILGASVYFLPVRTRVPLKFGSETLVSVTAPAYGCGCRIAPGGLLKAGGKRQ